MYPAFNTPSYKQGHLISRTVDSIPPENDCPLVQVVPTHAAYRSQNDAGRAVTPKHTFLNGNIETVGQVL